jgi:hypothetical protein
VTERTDGESTDSDGVLVVRAIAHGPNGRQLFRVSSETATEHDPRTSVVTDADELHRVVDAWLAALHG